MLESISQQAIEALNKAKVRFVLDHPFYATLLFKLTPIEDFTCKTMWTDGISLGYNPHYFVGLSINHQLTVLAHEVTHVANGHCWRGHGREDLRWNIAADHVSNLQLHESGYSIPENWYCDLDYLGMSVEQVYQLLESQDQSQAQSEQQSEQSDEPQEGQQHGSSSGDQSADQDERSNPSGENAETPDSSNEKVDPGEARRPPAETNVSKLEVEWKQSVINAAKAAQMMGSIPAGAQRLVDFSKRVNSDWRSILLRFATEVSKSDYSWKAPNSRYINRGIYLPSLIEPRIGTVYFGVDTSCSITDQVLSLMAEHINTVFDQCKPQKIVVIYADARINGIEEFEFGDEVKLTPCGGGGTDFRPFFEYIEKLDETPACAIYLTDTLGRFPSAPPSYPVLWASTREDGQVPFGELIFIDQ